ncbi:MAG: Ribonuclease HepT-like [Acidobacteriota bacterium]|nr:Ribonuclease HepT-like [Acidobacteriota bacterium]
MKGMRHILVHEYGRVNYEKVWEVVTDELPALSAELGRYLEMIE